MAMKKREGGFALIIVISLAVVIITIIAEIIFQTEIESRSALGERRKLDAEVSALSGAQFAKMLFVVDNAIPAAARTQVEQMLGGKPIFQLLDGFPIGAESFAQLQDFSKVNLSAALDTGLIEGLKNVPGSFTLKSTDESGKLNLNLAWRQDMARALYNALIQVFSTPEERKFLEEKGYQPERLAANIIDYVDLKDSDTIDNASDEGTQYEAAKFTHKQKNGPFESLEELRRVPGFHDDEIFKVFSPYFTVWPATPTSPLTFNVNSAAPELMAALLSPKGQEPNQDALDRFEDTREKKQAASNPDIHEACAIVTGNGKCPDFLQLIATTQSNIFKIEIEGRAGEVTRTLTYVFDRGIKPPGKDDGKGSPQTAAGGKDGAGATPPTGPKLKTLYMRFN
jgi:type II secretory pathway component PulK